MSVGHKKKNTPPTILNSYFNASSATLKMHTLQVKTCQETINENRFIKSSLKYELIF